MQFELVIVQLRKDHYVVFMANQYRYSRNSFNRSTVSAVGLTLIVCFLVWLFARLLGLQNANTITVISGLVFFGFCSAAMIWRYMRDEIVLAIRPDGLFDARYSSQAVPWDEIKDVRLERAENDFQLGVYLWPDKRANSDDSPEFIIDLSPLDASVEQILHAVAEHKSIYMERI